MAARTEDREANTDYATEFTGSPVDMIYNEHNKLWGFLCRECNFWVDLHKKEEAAKNGARSHLCYVEYIVRQTNNQAVCADATGNAA